MGKRGPKPQPTALRLLQGGATTRGVRDDEPHPPADAPTAPSWLEGYALEEWVRVSDDLYATGVYANVDQTALAAYCCAYQIWRHAMEDLHAMRATDPVTHAALIKTKNGNAIHNPLAGVASSAARDMLRLAAEFGLTPSARRNIAAASKGGGSDAESRYFRGG